MDELLRPGSSMKAPKDAVMQDCPGSVWMGRGDWPKALTEKAQALQELRYSAGQYGGGILLTDEDADRARAAGVLLELPSLSERTRGWVTSRSWLGDAIEARIAEETAAVKQTISTKKASSSNRTSSGGKEVERVLSEADVVMRIEREKAKQWKEEARLPNLEFGRELKHALLAVHPDDLDVARFFVYGLLGKNGEDGGYGMSEAARLASRGLRYVFEEWQTVEVKKSGAEKVHYLEPDDAEGRMWEWLDQADTAGDVFGRGLIIFAAARDASEWVVPKSQRVYSSASTGNKRADEALDLIIKDSELPPAALVKLAKRIVAFDERAAAKKEFEREKAEREKAAKPSAEKPARKPRAKAAASPAKTKAADCLKLVEGEPGITIPELARKMKVKSNYLYRVLPDLELAGKVEKKGRGWHPVK